MPLICYVDKRFNREHRKVISDANVIIAEYQAQGYDLTLRQLYYQFVARGFLENTVRSYKRLGEIVSDARRAGKIDWGTIVDRTRFLRPVASWEGPVAIVQSCADQFAVDYWEHQGHRPEVWVEKDALVGVMQVACREWQCPYVSCRGYMSDSEVWQAAQRMIAHHQAGYVPVVYHLGDHDPSGIDMSRDIQDRLDMFCAGRADVKVVRIALTMDQVREVDPPPNPAKRTDCRYEGYEALYGDESWELDALAPTYLSDLIGREIKELVDDKEWSAAKVREETYRMEIQDVVKRWPEAVKASRKKPPVRKPRKKKRG